MKRRRVYLTDRAKRDLRRLHSYIALRGAPQSAGAYVKRIVGFVNSLDVASERGTQIAAAGENIRAITFESVVIAARVRDEDVTVLRVYHASQDWLKNLTASFASPAKD